MCPYCLVSTCTHFFCKRICSDCKLSILKCRKGIYWFNSFKLITGLLLPSFLFTISIYCSEIDLIVDKIVPQHPSSRDFPLLIRLFPSLVLKSLFPLFLFFVLVCNGMEFDIPRLSAKYFDVLIVYPSNPGSTLTSLPVVLLESLNCRTILLPTDVLMITLLVALVVLWNFFKGGCCSVYLGF